MKYNTKLTLKIYWSEARKYWLVMFGLFVCVVGGSATGIIIPLYFKRFFDILAQGGTAETTEVALFGVLITIAWIEAFRWAFWRVAAFFNNYFQPKVMAALANYCFAYLHKHSFAYFNNNFVGSLVKRVNWFTRAFENVADKITWTIIPLFVDLTVVIFVLFRKDFWLGLGSLTWMSIFLAVNWIFTSYKIRFDVKRNAAETKSTGILADTITNNSNVKLFVGYRRELKTFAAAMERVRQLRRFTWNLDGIFEGVQGLLVVAFEIGIFYLAIKLWQQGKLTVGDFVLIQAYMIIIFEKVWDFGKIIRNLYTDLTDAEEMTVILNTPHEIQDVPKAKALKVSGGAIEFKEVDFYYHETRQIFDKLNLSISGGEKVALVGPSGAGKSTIVKILLRMHEVASGKIFIDNQKISHVTQESLWGAISLVPQDPILFHRTLMENIRYGKADATDAEVIKAAKLAHCHEFIFEFPDKYETYVGERGVKLSGGERQRVAIARAILRNAPILILDEATSSLDSESEYLIQDALDKLMKNKTVVVIAHRLSTIMRMDRIVVVNHGKIEESGTHQELLKKATSLYTKLWKRQAGGFMQD
ncbi:MAG: ABC transporter ATP-binding protein [Candidatus Magasanikbacteria bacterium]|nr:ABC transporter ATP-binding protein [Candidatus Magasanikbacteria bacterium]